jgi:hypothetical protein
MAFQKFSRKTVDGKSFFVKINKSLSVNFSVMAQELLDGFNYVELFYDEELKKIGIQPTNIKTTCSFAVARAPNKGNVVFAMGSFIRHYNLHQIVGHRIIPEKQEDMIVLNIADYLTEEKIYGGE